MGFINSFLYGGSLRDKKLGIQPKDYDFRMSAKSMKGSVHQYLESYENEFIDYDFCILNKTIISETDYSMQLGFGLEYQSKKIDLDIHFPAVSMFDLFPYVDAPINGVATDGQVTWAHPLFERHCREKIYDVSSQTKDLGYYEYRYNRLKEKIPELRIQWPQRNPENKPAP